MNTMSEYIAGNSEYVVVNTNYRLLGDNNNSVHINQIVEDAMGSLLWVKEHIANYKGDPARVAITGDSAGGQLSAMVLLNSRKLESDGFAGKTLGFKPTYLPKGKTAEKIAKRDGLRVQAAVISYAAFDLYKAAQYAYTHFYKAAPAKPVKKAVLKKLLAKKNQLQKRRLQLRKRSEHAQFMCFLPKK